MAAIYPKSQPTPSSFLTNTIASEGRSLSIGSLREGIATCSFWQTSLMPTRNERRIARIAPVITDVMLQALSSKHRQSPGRVGLLKSKPPGRFYDFSKIIWRGIFGFTMRVKATGIGSIHHHGGMIIAVSHISHLDPIVVSALIGRRISWMSRVEFHQQWLMRNVLYQGGAFQVDRTGPALPAIREGLRRLERGEAIGIFPEGELVQGPDSVLHGGSIKRGVCLLAARSGRPVLPVVVLGTEKLSRIGPWMPAKRGRLWVAVGVPLHAKPESNTRIGRAEFAASLESEYMRIYAEMRATHGLPDIAP
jgi:1-acyl-sn-glycerol-3-phosphate acyltransferase